LEDVAIRYDLQRTLADRTEVSVLIASSAWDMLHRSAAFEPDLVIFDHWMPDLLGDEFLEDFRKQRGAENVPVIVTCQNVGPEAVRRYERLGHVDLISEALPVAEFKRRVTGKLSLGFRRVERVAVALPVRIENEGRVVEGQTRDVSQKGAAVVTSEPLPEKGRVTVAFHSDDEPHRFVGSTAAVVHHISRWGDTCYAGLEFLEPPKQLVDYLTMRIKEGQKLGDLIGRIERIPSLPSVTARILEESLKEDCELANITSLVKSDPSLSAYMLKLANSAAYRFSDPVKTVDRAITLMGLRAVRNAVLGFSLLRHLSADNRSQMAYELWRHSVACGLACEKLAGYFRVPPDEAFTIGLLHDAGKFLLLSEFVRADNGYAGRQLLARWSLERERTLFGLSHAEIGAALLERWNVPDSICQVVAHHHFNNEKEVYPEYRPAVDLLRAADALTYSSHLGTGNGINDGREVLESNVPAEKLEGIRAQIYRDLSEIGEMFGNPIEPAALCAEIVEKANQRLAAELEQSQTHLEMLRRAYERTRQNLVSLAQAEKFHALGRIAAGVAHEINNPLSFSIANLQNLRQYCSEIKEHVGNENIGEIGDILQEIPDMISETVEGMQRVAEVVAALRHFGADTDDAPEMSNLVTCAREALALVHHAVPEGVEVVFQKQQVPDNMLSVNSIIRVIVEALQNALAALEGRGRIILSVWSDELWQYCCIRDDGKGMSPEQLNKVFEPFYSTRPVGQGRGLGLSIAYGIVSRHGGDIAIESEVGKGTTVKIRIPVRKALR
ncbi:MAG: HDOD domain-containing protein, partial [Deltaproteobacteria bacterium]